MIYTESQFDSIIVQKARIYRIDSDWIRAIISQESAWNPWAVRYEPDYNYLCTPVKFIRGTNSTLSTEISNQKMSWGLGQVMGALARQQGFLGILTELLKPDLNIEHMCKYIALLKGYTQEEEAIFAGYNGGLSAMKKRDTSYYNQKYVDRVMVSLKLYRTKKD